MKGSIILGALSLAGIAAAVPSGHRRHEHLHEKRQVVTEIDYVTAAGPDAVVYVDSEGNVLYTSYAGSTPATTAAASAATSVAVTSAAAVVATEAASSTAAASSSASSTGSGYISSSSSTSGASGLNGISYSPYSGSYADDNIGCKTSAQVSTDFASIPSEYNMVRIYGTDCNQVANVLTEAKSRDMMIFAGVYDISEVESEIATIVSAANGDWSNFDTINIGNELVNDGTATVAEVTAAITTARGLLKTAGYTGKIVTVDTFNAVQANPALCEASDYAAVNAHPYFDGSVAANDAGAWVLSQMEATSAACGGMDTMITETGWPWGGETLGTSAVPSVANQAVAVETIKGNVTSNVVMFTAFNDLWKAPGYMAVEQSWGMYGSSAAS